MGFPHLMKRFIDWAIRFVLGTTCRILCRMTYRNSHLVPKEGAFILACNHATWIDSLLLDPACPRRVRFILTETFHRKPMVHIVTHNTRSIPVDRKKPRSAILTAIAALKDGDPICIYPEGGFTRDGSIRDIQRGAEVMARGAGCPTVPVVITGALRFSPGAPQGMEEEPPLGKALATGPDHVRRADRQRRDIKRTPEGAPGESTREIVIFPLACYGCSSMAGTSSSPSDSGSSDLGGLVPSINS